jgi:hypothetical protein
MALIGRNGEQTIRSPRHQSHVFCGLLLRYEAKIYIFPLWICGSLSPPRMTGAAVCGAYRRFQWVLSAPLLIPLSVSAHTKKKVGRNFFAATRTDPSRKKKVHKVINPLLISRKHTPPQSPLHIISPTTIIVG